GRSRPLRHAADAAQIRCAEDRPITHVPVGNAIHLRKHEHARHIAGLESLLEDVPWLDGHQGRLTWRAVSGADSDLCSQMVRFVGDIENDGPPLRLAAGAK